EGDVFFGIDIGWPQQQSVHAKLAGEVFLRQRRALIGRVRLFADERDIALKAALAQTLRRLAAGLAGADDDDTVDFVHSHSGLAAAASEARAQGALDAALPLGQHSPL